jgi:hypothetical protein
MRLSLVFLAGLLLAGCQTTPAEDAQVAANDPDRLICRNDKVTGQNRRERVCQTAAQREAQRQATQDDILNRSRDRANVPPPALGGPGAPRN